MAAGYALIERLDGREVFLAVTSGVDEGFHTHLFLLVVDISHEDRHLGTQGDVVESLFPILHALTCALWRDGQLHPTLRVETSYHLVGDRGAMVPVDRNTDQSVEQQVERKDKPFFLDQEVGVTTNRCIKQFTDDKIPVAGMWRYANHALGCVYPRSRTYSPPRQAEQCFADRFSHLQGLFAQCGDRFADCVHLLL